MGFSWNLRKYCDGDEQAIVELLKIAYGKWYHADARARLEIWKWKYKKNPAGSPIIWLAEHDNKIISYFGLVPFRMKVGNTYMTGCYGADAATHPEYLGRGIFTSVWDKCNLDTAEKGIHITCAFPPRARVLGVYKRIERRGHICYMINMINVLDWESLLSRYIHSKILIRTAAYMLGKIPKSRSTNRNLKIEKINRFDERIDTFWKEISKYFKIIVKRDQRYLNWRYADHPVNKYTIYLAVKGHRILGYSVLTEMQWKNRVGAIVDILGFQTAHYNAVGHLIQKALKCFKEHDLDLAHIWISEKHPYRAIFRKAGFFTYPQTKTALCCAINLPGSYIDEKEVYSQALILSQNPFFKEKRNWFVMSGDLDAF